jgi:UDP-N-acetylmuramate--alanine ligase
VGKYQYLVIEADEHFASFLNYWPKIIVLTRLEADHLDYFKNFKNYLSAFRKFISHLPKDGVLVLNKDDKNIKQLTISIYRFTKSIDFSLKQPEAKRLRKILKVPGEHNVSNALAALTVARILKIPDKISFKALSEYRGSWRRFEEKTIKLGTKNLKLISDYGHHPTEISVTLRAARQKYPEKEIWCVYQPHQYQRTYYLFKDFVKSFRQAPADKLIITDIYDVAGREDKKIKKRVNSEKLVKAINKSNTIYLPKKEIIRYLKKNLRGGGVLIIMGAGDIYDIARRLIY